MYRFAKYTHWGQGHFVSSEKVSYLDILACLRNVEVVSERKFRF